MASTATHSSVGPGRRSRLAVIFNAACLVLGAVLLVLLVVKLDLQQVGARLRQVGWAFAGTFAAYVAGLVVTSAAWQCMVDPARSRATFRNFFAAFWAGHAINVLTPGGQLGGVLRGTILRDKVETEELIASLVTLTFFGYVSQLAFNLAVPLLCLALLDLPPRTVLTVLAVAIAFFVPMTLVYLFLRRGAAATIIRVLQKLPFVHLKEPEAVADKARNIDARIREFRQRRPRPFLRAVLWIALARLLLAAEYWVLLPVLLPDRSLWWLAALALLTQTSAQLLSWAMTFVPSQIGVAEANTTLLYKLLGLDPIVGLTLEIARRIRTLIGIAIGLLIGWIIGLRRTAKGGRDGTPPPRAPVALSKGGS
ncbi:MAG: flippase-like domain-containing protein [Deltaproteobacteria bacterium]|nr:flippase-like domain-containing protein [Deltaproteobacteria bacterium]